jgi:hypothetical protein
MGFDVSYSEVELLVYTDVPYIHRDRTRARNLSLQSRLIHSAEIPFTNSSLVNHITRWEDSGQHTQLPIQSCVDIEPPEPSLHLCSSTSLPIMDPTNLPTRTTPHWDLYRREMFMLATEQKHPLFSTDPNELERLAKEKLSEGGWLYASSNAGNSFTHRANREGKLARFMESIPHLTRD